MNALLLVCFGVWSVSAAGTLLLAIERGGWHWPMFVIALAVAAALWLVLHRRLVSE